MLAFGGSLPTAIDASMRWFFSHRSLVLECALRRTKLTGQNTMLSLQSEDWQEAVDWKQLVDHLAPGLLFQSEVVATDVLQIAVFGVDGRRVLPAG